MRMFLNLFFANAALTVMSFSLLNPASISKRSPSFRCAFLKDDADNVISEHTSENRRKLILLSLSASLLGSGSSVVVAAGESKQTYRDDKYGFTIDFPSSWSKMEDISSLGDRRSIVVYTDPSDSSTSILIVYTPIRDDFTSLNSFGSVDQVAAQTILPKGNLMDEDTDVTAKMISAVSSKQSYIFDYVQKVPQVQQPLTHYRTIFTLGNAQGNTAGAVLITVTLQTPESRYSMVQSTFDSIINSYQRV